MGSCRHIRIFRGCRRQVSASATRGHCILSVALDVARRRSAGESDGRSEDLETSDARRSPRRLTRCELSRGIRTSSGGFVSLELLLDYLLQDYFLLGYLPNILRTVLWVLPHVPDVGGEADFLQQANRQIAYVGLPPVPSQ